MIKEPEKFEVVKREDFVKTMQKLVVQRSELETSLSCLNNPLNRLSKQINESGMNKGTLYEEYTLLDTDRRNLREKMRQNAVDLLRTEINLLQFDMELDPETLDKSYKDKPLKV